MPPLVGRQTIKEGGIDEGEESEGDTDVDQELLDELRGGQTTKSHLQLSPEIMPIMPTSYIGYILNHNFLILVVHRLE